MAARHSKLKKRIRTYSENELCTRRYHSEVRAFKEWCQKHGIVYKTYDNADPSDVCVLSRDEYNLHDTRQIIFLDSECYFLSIEDYETWCEER